MTDFSNLEGLQTLRPMLYKGQIAEKKGGISYIMQLFLNGLIRGTIPFIILLLISIWSKLQGSEDTSRIFLFYSLIAFFLGLTSVIYQIKQWNFLKQIVAHYIAMLMTVFPTLLLLGAYTLDSFGDVLKVYLEFNKVGLILFFSSFFIIKLFKKMNVAKRD